MSSSDYSDDSSDEAHHSSKVVYVENLVFRDNLDVSYWWSEFQDDSTLASKDLSADHFQRIDTRLAFFDDLPLDIRNRGFYERFEESQPITEALKLIINSSLLDSSLQKTDFFLINNFGSVASKFEATFASLQSLTMSSSLHPDNITTLFTQLNAMPLLAELNFRVTEYDRKCWEKYNLLDYFWRPLAQLQSHSSLRHLSINLGNHKSNDQYEIPPLPILRQLTSFTFVDTGPQFSLHQKVIEALSKEQYGVHLTPGVGARFGLALFSRKNTTAFCGPQFTLVSIDPVLLPYITFLDVTLGVSRQRFIEQVDKFKSYKLALASLFRYLPEMRNLKKIKLSLNTCMAPTDYPSFLGALTSLTQLRELSFLIEWSKFNLSSLWSCTEMPVLPRVRDLSLKFVTDDHTDVVEHFHLVHCFPELRQFQCRFEHETSCERSTGNPQHHICGQELARGVIKLMPETIEKKIEFGFNGKVYFSSLDDLVAEGKLKEQLMNDLQAEIELYRRKLSSRGTLKKFFDNVCRNLSRLAR